MSASDCFSIAQWIRRGIFGLAFILWVGSSAWAGPAKLGAPRFDLSFPPSTQQQPFTGRLYLFVSHSNDPEVRLQDGKQVFAVTVNHFKAGQVVTIDKQTLGHPYEALTDLPEGDYYVQAFASTYVEYPRADGHVIWALDQWDGHDFTESPGNWYSLVQRVHFDPAQDISFKLKLAHRIVAVLPPADTAWIKHVKIKSALLSKFWGRSIYLGASILLPRDYEKDHNRAYPIIYEQKSHYLRDEAFGFSAAPLPETEEERHARENNGYENGYEFYKAWSSDNFPRVIIARLINPTPYYDYSGTLNSPNIGPYHDAIMKELISYIETHFRTIRQPYARILVGKSTGGRDALALQLYEPEFFGGAWIFHPWSFDYTHYAGINIYDEGNMFFVDSRDEWSAGMDGKHAPPWMKLERIFPFSISGIPGGTMQGWAHSELVQGGESNIDAEVNGTDNALNSPVGGDGYPKHLYDMATGQINHDVAQYWRDQGDLAYYAKRNWQKIARYLIGKLHLSIGDADEWYRQYSVYDFQKFLESTKDPYYAGSFVYGPRKGHGWQPMTNAELVRIVADYVARNAPSDADVSWKDRW